MSISRLKSRIIAYDVYGEYRTNGLKVLFVLVLLIVFYFFSSIPDPFFFYFYVPLTCFTAEIAGTTLKDKYKFLFFTIIGSIISIFLFGVFSTYKTWFAFFVFFYSAALYSIAIHTLKTTLVVVPLILGLASFSLIFSKCVFS